MKNLLFGLLAAMVIPAGTQAAPVLQLKPFNGLIGGMPGNTVGWGFTITNPVNYLVVTGSSFVPAGPSYGTYQDYIGTDNFVIVGPAPGASTVTEAFDASSFTGIGAFTIAASAPLSGNTMGTLSVNYSLFSQSPYTPFFNPSSALIAEGTFSAAADVRVTPEPGYLPLLATLFAVCAFWAKKPRSDSNQPCLP